MVNACELRLFVLSLVTRHFLESGLTACTERSERARRYLKVPIKSPGAENLLLKIVLTHGQGEVLN